MMRTASTTTWTGTETRKQTPTLVKGKSCSGTRQSVSCSRRTQWESPWRGRMKKRPQRWYLGKQNLPWCIITNLYLCNDHNELHICNSLSSSPGAVSCIPTPPSPTFWRLEAIGEPLGCQRGHPHLYLQLKVNKGLPIKMKNATKWENFQTWMGGGFDPIFINNSSWMKGTVPEIENWD